IASFTLRELLARRPRQALVQAGMAASIVLVLQLPYLVEKVRHPSSATRPGTIVESLSYTVANPSVARPAASFRATGAALEEILARPARVAWPGVVLVVAGAAAAYRFRRDPVLVAATVAPLAFTVAGFSFWQRPYETYWFMILAPSAALTVVLAATAWRPLARAVPAVLLAAVVLAQPARAAEALTLRLPEYGALVRGSRETARRLDEVRRIDVTFALPPTTEPDFVYRVLGGRLSPTAAYSVTIDRAGRARFIPAGEKPAVASRE
ncbi:MAG TPA: hypothetical protein VK911_04115, partial [Vicinamibacterales bacterium]|nr:hypothetical protein [Vicinamibacterales bacterium]